MRKKIIMIGILIILINFLIIPIIFGLNTIKSEYINLKLSNIKDEYNDHIWPMYKHDAQRTGRSSYDTSDNPGVEKWTYYILIGSWSSMVIDREGTIYAVSNGEEVFAIYSDGTRKWEQRLPTPYPQELLIGQDGTIYVGTTREFYAMYSNNGSVKWTLDVGGEKNYASTPVIDFNGTVYVGTADGYLYAIYPNSTIKWEYKIDGWVSAPALDKNGNVYFASRNSRVYCLSSNGSLKWSRKLTVFDNGPVIGDGGHIYLGPRTDWTYAYYPNGTEKWRTDIPDSEGMPCIAPNGNIIVPGRHYYIMTLDHSDGNILWKYPLDDNYKRISPSAICADGTIYFANCDEDIFGHKIGYLNAVNSDGTLRWRSRLTSEIQPYSTLSTMGAPVIGADGTVYVVSDFTREGHPATYGYVHAFGKLDPDAPSEPEISGPIKGKKGTEYNYIFKSESPLGRDVYFLIFWGDDSVERWIGPYDSGEEIVLSHSWEKWGKYTIKARTKDSENLWGAWGELTVTMPRSKETSYSFFIQFLERFPLLRQLFSIYFT
jgi:outer membrane protein assembly factor BamB